MVAFWKWSARISVIVWFNGENVVEISTYSAVSAPGNWFAGPFMIYQNNCAYIWSKLPIQFEVIYIMQKSHRSTSPYFWSSNRRNAKKNVLFS